MADDVVPGDDEYPAFAYDCGHSGKLHADCKFSTMYDFKGTAESTPEQMEFIPNRAFNVEKAASAISKYVVKPGKTFSFNDIVGDRTVERGWKLAQGHLWRRPHNAASRRRCLSGQHRIL